MKNTVRIGYEVGIGKPVDIPIAHMCVTGQTQLSGKTTTLEALIARSGRKAIAFVTKRGEGAFGDLARDSRPPLQPYFRHRADWQFVSDILGAILSEKLKFQRPWIMKLCRGAKTLREVADRTTDQLHGNDKKKIKPARGLAESVYTELDEYFRMLLPEIERLAYTDKLELRPGLNVMDLSAYSTALQMLVISATIERINQAEKNVIVVIPEAWEFVPNNRSSPVKSAAIALARKGAALHNFMWLDSQDLASIDTEVRRACSVWALGVQREMNEVKRTLQHIPNAPKPKADQIMQQEKGQFYVCHGREVVHVYVQPAWMSDELAILVAQGHTTEIPSMPPEFAKVASRGAAAKLLQDDFERDLDKVRSADLGDSPVSVKVTRVNSKTGAHSAGLATPSAPRVALADLSGGFKPDARDIARGVTIIEPDNTPKLRDYNTMPAGLSYVVDDGIIQPPEDHRKEQEEMDEAKEHAYQQQIGDLTFTVATLKKKLNLPLSAAEQALLAGEEPRPMTATEAMIKGEFDMPVVSPFAVAQLLLEDSGFISRVAAKIPTNGVVKVEPREVVLKEFLSAEVDRILNRTEAMSMWQKGVIKLLEARGSNLSVEDLFKRITGKSSGQTSSTTRKVMKDELSQLATLGFVRKDSAGRNYPNLENMVKAELAAYNPSEDDVTNCIGQVLLKLK